MAVLLPAGSGRRKEVIPQRLTVDQVGGHSRIKNPALQCGKPALQVRAKRFRVGGSGRVLLKTGRNHFDLPNFAVVGFEAVEVSEAKEAVKRDNARQEGPDPAGERNEP
jgi:hypothetical protein